MLSFSDANASTKQICSAFPSVVRAVLNFDPSGLSRFPTCLVAKCFPRISKHVESEEMRLNFVDFLERMLTLNYYNLIADVMFHSDDRDDWFALLEETRFREDLELRRMMIDRSLGEKGKPLFDCLKQRDVLDWNLIAGRSFDVFHIDGLKWIESNGIDILNDFAEYFTESPAEVMEYLIVERGMTLKYMFEENCIDLEMLKMIYRVKGLKEIQKIKVEKFDLGFQTIRFLRSIGYKFDKKKMSVLECGYSVYSLLCFNLFKLEDFEETDDFEAFIELNDLKACKQMYPYMKEIRKRKIMTFLYCVKKLYRMPKEIVWTILDYAFTPINE